MLHDTTAAKERNLNAAGAFIHGEHTRVHACLATRAIEASKSARDIIIAEIHPFLDWNQELAFKPGNSEVPWTVDPGEPVHS